MIGLISCGVQPRPVERQMFGLIEKFDRWDYDGSGQLDASELKEAERISGIPADELIEFYDENGDGLISLREAQAGMERVPEAREEVTNIKEQ